MLHYFRNPLVYLVAVAMLLASCATTNLTSVWKDPSYQSRPSKILVIGMARSPLNRRLFEDEFVRRLEAHGTAAIASYTVLTDAEQGDQALIAKKVAELGADAVLITRLVSKKVVQIYVPGTPYYPPPFYDTWPDYYAYGYRYLYTPGYITNDEYAVIETNLYDAKTNKLIWAASSETGITGTNQKLIKSYIGVMVKNMIALGLLGS
jgi:hypothetical protein